MALDELVYRWIGSMHGRSAIFDFVMLLFELHLLRYILIGLLLAVWLTRNPSLQKGAIVALAAVAAAVLLRPFVKGMVYRPRPWITEGCPGLAPCYPDSSFPSGHLFFATAMVVVLWRADRRAGIAMAIICCLIGLSRVYLGEHWPSDLLAGAVLGGLLGFSLSKLSELGPLDGVLSKAVRIADRFKIPAKMEGEPSVSRP